MKSETFKRQNLLLMMQMTLKKTLWKAIQHKVSSSLEDPFPDPSTASDDSPHLKKIQWTVTF